MPIPPAPNKQSTNTPSTIHKIGAAIMIQDDIGANRCVTDNASIIVDYTTIEPYQIGGVEKDEVAITCTGKGYIPWYSTEGHEIMVKCYYSAECDGIIFSPTAIVKQYNTTYQGHVFETNCDANTGYLKILHHDGVSYSYFQR